MTRHEETESSNSSSTPLHARMNASVMKFRNELQDALSEVGINGVLDLPHIVVVGSQSSGKSSVLQSLVGRDFLPCGPGLVTRRPLVLQLINRSPAPITVAAKGHNNDDAQEHDEEREPEEWGEFLHQPGVKYTDFSRIRDEILLDTAAKAGKNGISPLPINLSIFSPHVLTITLVDLPGLTKMPVRDQPKDIEQRLRNMILEYITKPNVIILAVTPANTTIPSSDGLMLAKLADPEGARTIGVLTKIDLMDAATNVVDILSGRVIPLRLGYIPVINRSQRDIDRGKSISQSLHEELSFFENHDAYKAMAQYCGIPYLSRKLVTHLIRSALPKIETKIQDVLTQCQNELADPDDMLREGTADPASLGLVIITKFCNEFRTVAAGNITDTQLTGANFCTVIQKLFADRVESINPFDQVREGDDWSTLSNSSTFEEFILPQFMQFDGSSLSCVELVFDELVRIVDHLVSQKKFKKFPQLGGPFYQAIIDFLRRQLDTTKKVVTDLIYTECYNIITEYSDLFNGENFRLMVCSSFESVKITLIDAVPRAIMGNLVNAAMDGLLPELLQELCKTVSLDEWFEVGERHRNECIKKTKALHRAKELAEQLQSYFTH